MKAIWCGLVVLLLISSGLVVAQDYYYGPHPDHYGSRAATPGESHARGMSDVIRSQGQYNVQTSGRDQHDRGPAQQHPEP